MDHEARTAEIAWLRRVVAAGSHDITRFHLPLIGHLIEVGETAEAITLLIVAADHFWAQGFLLKAFAVLRRALALEPHHPELTARFSVWRAAVDPALLPVVDPPRRSGGTVTALQPFLEEHCREQITRCTIRAISDPTSLRVELEHTDPLPESWLAGARYAVAIAGYAEAVPCIARLETSQAHWHAIELTPADAAAAALLRALVRIHPVTELSNIAALVIDAGVLPPLRVRNVYCLAPHGAVAQA
ncbi:hypothetical protein HY635_02415 [Candidatus Uhrbacteria bacterium]|nr:hypothetical protein [Candidatus Uhrbacteria bacterium]